MVEKTVKPKIDIMKYNPERYVGRNGKPALRAKVAHVDVPKELVGHFLSVNSTTGDVFMIQAVKLTDAEKASNKKNRDAQRKVRLSGQVKINAQAVKEIKALADKIRETKVEIRSAATKGKDVTALQEKIRAYEASQNEWRGKKRFVPKAMR